MNSPDARTRLVLTAVRLFQKQGFHGTGLTQLLSESETPKGSFYHYFPRGKEEVAAVAVAAAAGDIARRIDREFNEAEGFADGALRAARVLAGWFEASGYAAGCPVTTVLLETVPASPRLAAATAAAFGDWVERVATHAQRLGVANPRESAEALVIALEGAWILSRAQRSTAPFEMAARMAAGVAR